MSKDVILVVDFNSVCRFCLQSNGTLSSIFSGEDKTLVSTQIERFTDIKIDPGDSFPSKICHRCRFKVEFCFDFREMVLRTQKALIDNLNDENELENEYSIENIHLGFEPDAPDSFKNGLVKNEQTDFPSNIERDFIISNTLEQLDPNLNIFLLENEQDVLEYNKIEQSMQALQQETIENTPSPPKTVHKKNTRHSEKKNTNSPFVKMKEYPSMLTASRRNQCLLCLQKCGNANNLKEHVEKHLIGTNLEPYYMLGERNITCRVCNKQFSYRFSFLTHQREHLKMKPFLCHYEGCDMAFYSNSSLRQHLPIHGDKRFICSICAVGFKRKSDLRAHEIIHQDAGMQFNCPICKLICKNRLTLAAHVRKHCIQPRFKCDVCPKSYFSQSELDRHSNIHTGEKCFRCTACPSAYYSRAALVRHERGHLNS